MLSKIRRILLSLVIMTASLPAVAQKIFGVASWYGAEHAGRRMANGAPFDPSKLTAASKYLPLGTWVKVTYLRTMKSVTVQVTDRGPYVHHRIIDLSEAAAKAIGLRGIGEVSIEVLR